MLFLLSAVVVSCAIAMDSTTTRKLHATEMRIRNTKEDMIQTMIANSYLSNGAEIDFVSLDRPSILMQLQKRIDTIPDDNANPAAFDNHIALFNTISFYDKKIKRDIETKNKRFSFSSMWYSLPFVTKPQPLNASTKLPLNASTKLPIEQQRILFEVLKKDDIIKIPSAEKIKTFFESHVNDNNVADVTSYKWHKSLALKLPTTFCNGLVKATSTEEKKPLDMSPKPNEIIIPATQYWQHENNIRMSDDTTHTDVTIPGNYSLFDASQSHFVGLNTKENTLNEKGDTIQLFQLPRRVRKYEICTSKENDVVEVQNIADKAYVEHTIEKPLCTKKEECNISALIACQQTQEIVYAVPHDKNSQLYIQKIKGSANLSPLSAVIDGVIKHIVQLDCFNFICLTLDGSLHRVTKKWDNKDQKIILEVKTLKSNAQFSHIAIDRKTDLCAVVQPGIDHKDSIYVIDKNILKQSDRFC
jgi:hypothetical protein